MNNNVFSVVACPAEYQEKPFLELTDIMNILITNENSYYRYLQSDLPFKKLKVRKLIRINAISS